MQDAKGIAYHLRLTKEKSWVLYLLAVIAAIVLCAPDASAQNSNEDFLLGGYDYSWLTDPEYRRLSAVRGQAVGEAETVLADARDNVESVRERMTSANAGLADAWQQYLAAIPSGDREQLLGAWKMIGRALSTLQDVRDQEEAALSTADDARVELTYKWFWQARLENDWHEREAARGALGAYTVAGEIARCRPGGGKACTADGLRTTDTRFAVFQPVLAMVGVHHAHAKGLTGKGVRVAVEDDAVNYSLREFAGRVSFEGARIVYPRPLATGIPDGARSRWYVTGAYEPFGTEDPFIHESITADFDVRTRDWTTETWLENRHSDALSWDRFVVIPAVESTSAGLSHGTRVASVAVGRDFGVAPGATLIPIFKDFARAAQAEQRSWSSYLLRHIWRSTPEVRRQWDEYLAKSVRADYANYDVINRSFGIGVFDPEAIQEILTDASQWWGEDLRRLLPLTWRAYMQTDVHPDDRAVVVYAAGNEQEEWGGLGADLPYYERHVRGHHLSVMAVDSDGSHAVYTNFCGPLPDDWDAARWGRHYCLAAPGTVNAVSNRPGFAFQGTTGTSFAAPIVTGAIALLMEHFRGDLGHGEIVRRLLDTANNGGRYAQLEIYGAGLLDLQAALRPVGSLFTGTPSLNVSALSTEIMIPASMGSLGARFAAAGVEVASLDSLGAPFWSSPRSFFRAPVRDDDFVPNLVEPDGEEAQLHLGFTQDTLAASLGQTGYRLLIGPDRVGLEVARPHGVRWGLLGDRGTWFGGRPSGAFGDEVRSVTAWIGHDVLVKFTKTLTFRASATLALGDAAFVAGGMLDVDPFTMSTWNLGVERGERGRGAWSRFSLSQPLRAESGKATLTYLSGLSDGTRVHDQATVSLAPGGREHELAFTHEVPLGAGRGVFEVSYAWDAGHESGRERARIGAAYQLRW